MMKVLRASRKFSALSSLDGTRNGILRPACKANISIGQDLGNRFSIASGGGASFTSRDMHTGQNSIQPEIFKFFFLKSTKLEISEISLHVPFRLRHLDVTGRTGLNHRAYGLDGYGQESI